jgi:hypothetical protein
MGRCFVILLSVSLLLTAATAIAPARADEGMWLLNHLPLEKIQAEYGFTPTPAWVEHLERAAVKFGRGGSASFISADGLILTNHHVARSQLAKLSTPEHDLLVDGYLAHSPDEELKCPDVAVMSLQDIVDVTDRVEAATAGIADPAAAEAARNAEIAAIERESLAKTGLTSEVVTLYGGGRYHLYRYKRFTDVRIVFAPGGPAADFGGDEDNFEFPRYCLDVSLLRVYDHGKPYHPEHYLKMAADGVAKGDPVFVIGHPGRTQRLDTVADLEFLRDVQYPRQMRSARTREVELLIYSNRGEREARLARRELLGVQNWRKGTGSKLRALEDPRIFAQIVAREKAFRDAVAANPKLQREVGNAWDEIAAARKVNTAIYDRYQLVEGGRRSSLGGSDLFRIARTIVRFPVEHAKPDGERLEEYRESNLPNLELALYSRAPIVNELEIGRLESHLALSAEILGGEDPAVRIMLGGKSPAERARELVEGSKLADPAGRRALMDGGRAAVEASTDPKIPLAQGRDAPARAVRSRYENEVEAVLHDAYARLAKARFVVYGEDVYPDATGTLRLATGRVQGFDLEGTPVGPFTDFAGLFRRQSERGPLPPFYLPENWLGAENRLDLSTPLNFTSTNDIIGGNSGSPVVNRNGEWVGVIFDGNRYSFVWDVLYPENGEGRAVSVDGRGLVEALRKVYGADALALEVSTGKPAVGGE